MFAVIKGDIYLISYARYSNYFISSSGGRVQGALSHSADKSDREADEQDSGLCVSRRLLPSPPHTPARQLCRDGHLSVCMKSSLFPSGQGFAQVLEPVPE